MLSDFCPMLNILNRDQIYTQVGQEEMSKVVFCSAVALKRYMQSWIYKPWNLKSSVNLVMADIYAYHSSYSLLSLVVMLSSWVRCIALPWLLEIPFPQTAAFEFAPSNVQALRSISPISTWTCGFLTLSVERWDFQCWGLVLLRLCWS